MSVQAPKRRGKKRRRVFTGIQHQHLPRVEPERDQTVEIEDTTTLSSASKRKLSGPEPFVTSDTTSGTSPIVLRPRVIDSVPEEASNSLTTEEGTVANRIINFKILAELFSTLGHCIGNVVYISEGSNKSGLVTKISVCCTCGWSYILSDPYNSTLNRQSVLAMRLIGAGERSLQAFCAVMNLPGGVTTCSYEKHADAILNATFESVKADQLSSANELQVMNTEGNLFIPPQVDTDSDSDTISDNTSDNDNEEQDDEEAMSESDVSQGSSDEDSDVSSYSHSSSDESESYETEDALCAIPQVFTMPPLGVTVTFDGTWSKRGYSALYGVVAVISWDTGRVLDTCVLSKVCRKCSLKRNKLRSSNSSNVDSEFQKWFEKHESFCEINHKGSSGSMEVKGALVLWRRSVEKLNVRYVNVISDGDSKAIKAVQNDKPYGPDIKITKFECVGHIQKRVGAAFIALTKNPPTETVVITKPIGRGRGRGRGRGAKNTLTSVESRSGRGRGRGAKNTLTSVESRKVKIGGRNGITKQKYRTLQQYYGNAIRANAGNLDSMVKACWAVYFHSISTDKEPYHKYCPEGAASWCKFNRSKPLNVPLPSHPPPEGGKRFIPLRLKKYVLPIFQRLCDRKLLAR